MSNPQQKADSIKSKEYINLLKAYFQTLKPIIGEKQFIVCMYVTILWLLCDSIVLSQ